MNVRSFLISLIFCALFTVHSFANTVFTDENNKTIILINGEAHLVELDSAGNLINTLILVDDYFTTVDSHDYLVQNLSDLYESELATLSDSRLIIFVENNSLLTDIGVNNIRELAKQYSKGQIDYFNLIGGKSSSLQGHDITQNRLNSIIQLFRDFGVDTENIHYTVKDTDKDLPNHFIKIEVF